MRLIPKFSTPLKRSRTMPRRAAVERKSPAQPPPARPKVNTRFKIGTLIHQCLGKGSPTRALDCIRVLPARQRDKVILQATDGSQAVCLIAPGSATSIQLVPAGVLPKAKPDLPTDIARTTEGWRSSHGREAPPCERTAFPPIGSVLPDLEGKPHVTLTLDTALLHKLAASLGTSQLHLMIPAPQRGRSAVDKAVAVCPASADAAEGIGVLMPLHDPERPANRYHALRQDVLAAESPRRPTTRRNLTTVTGDVRATVWIGSDLTQARVISMDADRRALVIELQKPSVLQVSLDPQASRIAANQNGLWVLALDSTHEAVLTQQIFAEARQQISQHPLESHLARRAELHAHTVLRQLFDASGWDLAIHWRGP